MDRFTRISLSSTFALLLAACAGSKQNADAPQEAPASAEASAPEASATPGADAQPGPEQAESEASEPSGPPLKDIVASGETAFVFDFLASDIGKKTEEQCRKSAGDDMKKFADCKRKVQDKLGMPILRFEEQEGSWWWLTYDRRGSDLVLMHKIEFTFGEETEDTLKILPKGRDRGKKPRSVPSELVIAVPNPNSIAIDDPQHGKMVYRARVGILEKPEQ